MGWRIQTFFYLIGFCLPVFLIRMEKKNIQQERESKKKEMKEICHLIRDSIFQFADMGLSIVELFNENE